MLKVGILGLGGMGWFHISRYLQLPDVKIVAIADIGLERLDAKKMVQMNIDAGNVSIDLSKVVRYPDANTLIREAEVDMVDICLPTDLHAEYAIQALNRGRHVLCEKPMARSVTEADVMINTAQQTKRLLMIAQVIRFWPEYLFLRHLIEDSTYGTLRSLNMWRIGARPAWSRNDWFLDPKRSGGVILDMHIHDVDYVNAVFGQPDYIYATGRLSADAKSYDVIHSLFTYEGGPQVHMHAGWSPANIPFQAGYEAWFDLAFVRYAAGKLDIYDGKGPVELQRETYMSGDGYLNEIAYFIECIRTGTQPINCLPESTRDSIYITEQELKSMRDNIIKRKVLEEAQCIK